MDSWLFFVLFRLAMYLFCHHAVARMLGFQTVGEFFDEFLLIAYLLLLFGYNIEHAV